MNRLNDETRETERQTIKFIDKLLGRLTVRTARPASQKQPSRQASNPNCNGWNQASIVRRRVLRLRASFRGCARLLSTKQKRSKQAGVGTGSRLRDQVLARLFVAQLRHLVHCRSRFVGERRVHTVLAFVLHTQGLQNGSTAYIQYLDVIVEIL